MKKMEDYVSNLLIEAIKKNYGLVIKKDTAKSIVRYLINQMNYCDEDPSDGDSFLYTILRKWFSSTKIPRNEFRKHSSYYFVKYVLNRFYVVGIKKPKYWKIFRRFRKEK